MTSDDRRCSMLLSLLVCCALGAVVGFAFVAFMFWLVE